MDSSVDSIDENNRKILAHKRFRISFDFDATLHEAPIYPDDEALIKMLRMKLLSNDDLLTRFLLSRCMDQLAQEMDNQMLRAGFRESTVTEIVQTVGRTMPYEVIEGMMIEHLDGWPFLEPLTEQSDLCSISSMAFYDIDKGAEITLSDPTVPLFYINDFHKLVLVQTEIDWRAGMRVRLNRETDQEKENAVQEAFKWIDRIHEIVSGSPLPLTSVDIGICAYTESEYEVVRAMISEYAASKVPTTSIVIWFRQEEPARWKPKNLLHLEK